VARFYAWAAPPLMTPVSPQSPPTTSSPDQFIYAFDCTCGATSCRAPVDRRNRHQQVDAVDTELGSQQPSRRTLGLGLCRYAIIENTS
jgi:hypothetical protein